jgi:asparagine synthase (glutamine-hydrolysing)
MCGIAGTTRVVDRAHVVRAEELLKHRGPNGSRIEVLNGVTMLHRRLAIIDLEERALQPLWTKDRTKAIIFNGEIYNYRKLKAELAASATFETEGDSEVILKGYEVWGEKVFERLSGMFALAIVDATRHRVILARDHAGMKPLWYHHTVSGGLTWSSELRSLFTLCDIQPDDCLMEGRLNEYFALGYIASPRTLYKDVHVLPRGSYAMFDCVSKELNIVPFVPDTCGVELTTEACIESSVLEHLVSDVPVGLFFSGGVDSSLLAAILMKHGVQLKAFSLSMPGRSLDTEYGTEIAKMLELACERREFDTALMMESYQQVMKTIDVPIADISLLPTWAISKEAKKEVTVVLSGEGGDELFMGYQRHHTLRSLRFIPGISHLFSALLEAPDVRGKGTILRTLASYGDPSSYYLSACSLLFVD